MPTRQRQTRQILTKGELELFESSLQPRLADVPLARLRAKLVRTRRLRDKNRDLSQRQRRVTRGKEASRSSKHAHGPDAMKRKAALLQEAVQRFEAAVARRGVAKAPRRAKGKTQARTKARVETKARSRAVTKRTGSGKQTKGARRPAASAGPTGPTTTAAAAIVPAPAAIAPHDDRSAAKPPAKPAPSAKETRPAKRRGAMSPAAANKAHFDRTQQRRVRGHGAARTRRNQARRDSR